MIFFQLDVILG